MLKAFLLGFSAHPPWCTVYANAISGRGGAGWDGKAYGDLETSCSGTLFCISVDWQWLSSAFSWSFKVHIPNHVAFHLSEGGSYTRPASLVGNLSPAEVSIFGRWAGGVYMPCPTLISISSSRKHLFTFPS